MFCADISITIIIIINSISITLIYILYYIILICIMCASDVCRPDIVGALKICNKFNFIHAIK